MRILYWLVTALVALFFVIFAVSNLASVEVRFWPLPITFGAPLFIVVLVAALAGFFFGEFVAWVNGRRWRRDARSKTRRIDALERELAATQAQLATDSSAARLPGTGVTRA